MAKEDVILKKYMSDKVRFSDLVNGSLFGGQQIIQPEHLTELDGEADLYLMDKNGRKKSVMRYRDVVMKADCGLYFAVLAEENQKSVHYAMPVRNMLYDALSYTEQVEQIKKEHERKGDRLTGEEFLSGITKEDRIVPVITLVVYYGEEDWDGKIDIYGMMGLDENNMIPEKIRTVLPNYKINLIHAGNMEGLENFKTDLQLVFGMLQYRKDKCKMKDYINQNKEALGTMNDETCEVIGILLHEEKRMAQYRKKESEEPGMCKAFDEIFADERAEGRREVQIEVIQKKLSKGKTIEEIADALEESKERILELIFQMQVQ